MASLSPQQIIYETRWWMERVVLGLNLCPFAHQPFKEDRIQFVVSEALEEKQLHGDLLNACEALLQAEPKTLETTLLIHPNVLEDFEDYCAYLELANTLLIEQGYEGQLQIASFHPQYCFHDSPFDDPANFTNRSPYPMLHILREDSVANAVEHYKDVHNIPLKNMERLRKMGNDKFLKLLSGDIDA